MWQNFKSNPFIIEKTKYYFNKTQQHIGMTVGGSDRMVMAQSNKKAIM
jgi:hypothetical protein